MSWCELYYSGRAFACHPFAMEVEVYSLYRFSLCTKMADVAFAKLLHYISPTLKVSSLTSTWLDVWYCTLGQALQNG